MDREHMDEIKSNFDRMSKEMAVYYPASLTSSGCESTLSIDISSSNEFHPFDEFKSDSYRISADPSSAATDRRPNKLKVKSFDTKLNRRPTTWHIEGMNGMAVGGCSGGGKSLRQRSIKDRNLYIGIRNARERYRVFQINEAFARLRQVIPYTTYRKKRVSKVKTLTTALQYIAELEQLLQSGT